MDCGGARLVELLIFHANTNATGHEYDDDDFLCGNGQVSFGNKRKAREELDCVTEGN